MVSVKGPYYMCIPAPEAAEHPGQPAMRTGTPPPPKLKDPIPKPGAPPTTSKGSARTPSTVADVPKATPPAGVSSGAPAANPPGTAESPPPADATTGKQVGTSIALRVLQGVSWAAGSATGVGKVFKAVGAVAGVASTTGAVAGRWGKTAESEALRIGGAAVSVGAFVAQKVLPSAAAGPAASLVGRAAIAARVGRVAGWVGVAVAVGVVVAPEAVEAFAQSAAPRAREYVRARSYSIWGPY